jgi:hypothetical protein
LPWILFGAAAKPVGCQCALALQFNHATKFKPESSDLVEDVLGGLGDVDFEGKPGRLKARCGVDGVTEETVATAR